MGVIGEGPGGGASIFPSPHTDHGRVMHPPGKLESGWVGECVALSTSERFRDVAVLYWRVIPCTHACRGFLGRCNLLLRPSVAYWVLTASNLRLNSI